MKRVLFIGAGSIGERHIRCFLRTGRIVARVCEPNAERRDHAARQYRLKGVYDTLDQALLDQHDVALVATPTQLHVEQALRVVDRGIDVLIEKPLSVDFKGVDTLQQRIAETQVKAAVMYFYRTHPALVEMKAALDQQRFGMPVTLIVTTGQYLPLYRPQYHEVYFRDRATGGGVIQDFLTHLVNAAEWLVGPVDRVLCDAAHKVLPKIDVEDTAHIIARHGDVMASYTQNAFQFPDETTITVHCERGSAQFDLGRHCWRWIDQPGGDWTVHDFGPLERDDVYVRQANTLLDFLEDKRPAPCPVEDAVQTLRVNLALLRSADGPPRFVEIDD